MYLNTLHKPEEKNNIYCSKNYPFQLVKYRSVTFQHKFDLSYVLHMKLIIVS